MMLPYFAGTALSASWRHRSILRLHRMSPMTRLAALPAFLSALLLATALLAPRAALAHGATAHAGEQMHADRALLVPSCPGGHGEYCTCGDQVACSGDGSITIAPPPHALLAFVPVARSEPRQASRPRVRPPAFSLRFSRAPPAFS